MFPRYKIKLEYHDEFDSWSFAVYKRHYFWYNRMMTGSLFTKLEEAVLAISSTIRRDKDWL